MGASIRDGAPVIKTRARLLAAAGKLFAARGADGVTAKEICEAADVVPAAVNYHFGGLLGIYEAVLIEARDVAISGDRRLALLQTAAPAEEKLRGLITYAVRALLLPEDVFWIAQLFGREITHPTPIGKRILDPVVMPRIQALKLLVAQIVDASPDSLKVICLGFIVGTDRIELTRSADAGERRHRRAA